jgi:hypothetical protein
MRGHQSARWIERSSDSECMIDLHSRQMNEVKERRGEYRVWDLGLYQHMGVVWRMAG